jgi:DNA processing protein
MDTRSAGCNELIRQNQATMLTSGKELPAAMGWSWPKGGKGTQKVLPLGELSLDELPSCEMPSAGAGTADAENTLLDLLKQQDSLTIDEITARTGLPCSSLALLLLRLELKGAISALPGKRYRLHVSENGSITHTCH